MMCTSSNSFWNPFLPATVFSFNRSEDGVYFLTRSDGNRFNLARLRPKTRLRKVLIKEMLIAHSEEDL